MIKLCDGSLLDAGTYSSLQGLRQVLGQSFVIFCAHLSLEALKYLLVCKYARYISFGVLLSDAGCLLVLLLRIRNVFGFSLDARVNSWIHGEIVALVLPDLLYFLQ